MELSEGNGLEGDGEKGEKGGRACWRRRGEVDKGVGKVRKIIGKWSG